MLGEFLPFLVINSEKIRNVSVIIETIQIEIMRIATSRQAIDGAVSLHRSMTHLSTRMFRRARPGNFPFPLCGTIHVEVSYGVCETFSIPINAGNNRQYLSAERQHRHRIAATFPRPGRGAVSRTPWWRQVNAMGQSNAS